MAGILKKFLPALLIGPAILMGISSPGAKKEDAGVVFSHEMHVTHMGMECDICHEKTPESTSGADDLMPTAEHCLTCHSQEDVDVYVTRKDAPRAGRLVVDYNPKFNHAAHIAKEISCERCHVGISASDSSHTTHMPVMALCMSCHDGFQADKDCFLCHSEPNGPLPADHILPAWRKQHGDNARFDNARSCAMCHERHDCQECHQGDNLLPRVHPPGFEYSHPREVLSGRMECNTCHEGRSFCIECHTERHVYPRSHQRTSWANTGSGGVHAAQARMNIEQCASCHSDEPSRQPVCATCHGR